MLAALLPPPVGLSSSVSRGPLSRSFLSRSLFFALTFAAGFFLGGGSSVALLVVFSASEDEGREPCEPLEERELNKT